MITYPLTDRYAVARLRIVAAPALCCLSRQNLSRLALSLISLGGRALFIPIATARVLSSRSRVEGTSRLRGVRRDKDHGPQFLKHALRPFVERLGGLRAGPHSFIPVSPCSVAGMEKSTDENRKPRTT